MKSAFLLLALAVMLGVSAGLSLSDRRMADSLLNRLHLRKVGGKSKGSETGDVEQGKGRKGSMGKGGKGDDDEDKKQEYLEFSAMLAYSALAGKCEVASLYVEAAALEANMTFEEIWTYTAPYMPTLSVACPEVKEFLDRFEIADEKVKDEMVEGMAPYGLLMQCATLFAEVDTMILLGFTNTSDDGTPESRMMVHGQPLFDGCIKIFGGAEQEAKSVDEDLQAVEAEASEDRRSTQLRSLLKELEEVLRRR